MYPARICGIRLYDVRCRAQAPQVIAGLSQVSQLDQPDQAAPAFSGLSWPLSRPRGGLFLRWASIAINACHCIAMTLTMPTHRTVLHVLHTYVSIYSRGERMACEISLSRRSCPPSDLLT